MRKVIIASLLVFGLGVALYVNCSQRKEGASQEFSSPIKSASLLEFAGESDLSDNFLEEDKEVRASLLQKEDPYLQAIRFLGQKRYKEALQLIGQNKHLIEKNDAGGELWAALLAEVSSLQKDVLQLRVLWKVHPKSIVGSQEASLLLADSFIDSLDYESYLELRKAFVGKRGEDPRWIFLDVDKLLFDGKRDSAIALLEKSSLEGESEVERLLVLAKLSLANKPIKAWNLLQQAHALSPKNGEIASLQATILEMGGKYAAAEESYIDACRYCQNKALAREQLGSFYVREGKFLKAAKLFREDLNDENIDLSIKALFWSKVIEPEDFAFAKLSDLQGESFALYLAGLKPWEFWNQEHFSKAASELQLPSSAQAAMWLQLLHYLKQGEEQKALAFLEKEAILEDSWDPGLLLAIGRTLSFRQEGTFSYLHPSLYRGRMDKSSIERQQKARTLVQKIASLDSEANIDKDLSDLLKTPRIWNYLLVDAGWNEAAIEVGSLSHIPLKEAPKEIQDKLIGAIKQNRGPQSALAFLQLLEESDSVLLEKGMIYLFEGNYEKAEKALQMVARYPNKLGEKACFMLAQAYLEQGKPYKARDILKQGQALETVQGKELSARIALKEGNSFFAEEIYRRIADESLEAKSYFAMRAYEQKEWQKAHEYTLELLQSLPSSKSLQENLKKIEEKIAEENQYS